MLIAPCFVDPKTAGVMATWIAPLFGILRRRGYVALSTAPNLEVVMLLASRVGKPE